MLREARVALRDAVVARAARVETAEGGGTLSLLHIVVLALVQGITEFLPISSSAHLILVPTLTGWPDQDLVIDVAVHVGTLGAVMVYLWRDLYEMLLGLGQMAKRHKSPGGRLLGLLILATIPVMIAGYLLNDYATTLFRSVEIIAWTTLVFGVLLFAVDKLSMQVRRIDHMGWGAALFIGASQVLALVPGTSRSGITMTAARMLGFERRDAARFSMLLSIPTILGAGVLKGMEIYRAEDAQLGRDAILSAGLAFVAALAAIALMMAWLKRASFTPFALYRVALSAFLLYWIYFAS